MLDSAGDASWVRMHAYKTCSEYRIYKNTNVPVLRIHKLLAISSFQHLVLLYDL